MPHRAFRPLASLPTTVKDRAARGRRYRHWLTVRDQILAANAEDLNAGRRDTPAASAGPVGSEPAMSRCICRRPGASRDCAIRTVKCCKAGYTPP